jgi:phosphoserine phosphatase
MHIVTLIGPAGKRPPATDAALAIVAHGGLIHKEHWLENGTAYDIHFEGGDPMELNFVLHCLADRAGCDVVLQPGPRREKKILVSDMDSTIIEQECIDEIAAVIGLKKKVAAITQRAMNGELVFEDALRERVALLKGIDKASLQKVLDERITLMPGATTLIATLRAHGVYCLLVSGGFTFFTRAVRERAGFDADEANILGMEEGVLTGNVAEPILGKEAKVAALQRAVRERGLTLSKTIAIGDGANDLPMIETAGLGIAYHAKPSVEAAAPARIRHCDLTALLYILGIPRDEWVIKE